MKEYQGKSKAVMGLGIAILVMLVTIIGMLIIAGVNGITMGVALFLAFIMSFLYKGMVIKITVDAECIQIFKPLGKKVIKFSNIAFCMVHGIDETDSIIYAFVKKRIGKSSYVKGVKQKMQFDEVVKVINRSNENIDLDINFNMAEKIPVSLVENTEEIRNHIINTLGGFQKKILSNI